MTKKREIVLSKVEFIFDCSTGNFMVDTTVTDPDKVKEIMNKQLPDYEDLEALLSLLKQSNSLVSEVSTALVKTAKGL